MRRYMLEYCMPSVSMNQQWADTTVGPGVVQDAGSREGGATWCGGQVCCYDYQQ